MAGRKDKGENTRATPSRPKTPRTRKSKQRVDKEIAEKRRKEANR